MVFTACKLIPFKNKENIAIPVLLLALSTVYLYSFFYETSNKREETESVCARERLWSSGKRRIIRPHHPKDDERKIRKRAQRADKKSDKQGYWHSRK